MYIPMRAELTYGVGFATVVDEYAGSIKIRQKILRCLPWK